jgi:antitoxin component HigA of HigAB toxin-antitoxin module
MNITPISTIADYKATLAIVPSLVDKDPVLGAPDADRFDRLITLTQAYQDRHFCFPSLEPIRGLKYLTESSEACT